MSEEASAPLREPFVVHGDARQMFEWIKGTRKPPMEAIFEGVAGCGKTRAIGEWIHVMCRTYPKSKGLVVRSTRVSLNDSFLDIWENEVLGPTHPAVLGMSRAHRASYHHPTLGGEVVLGGMDNLTKLFSTQYNWIYFNEVQEEKLKDGWESLHRALRRPGTPFRVLIGDCNPESQYHWILDRFNSGRTHRMIGHFEDNPKWYDHAARQWTPEGREYISRLREMLTGVQLRRLYRGEWCAAEGQVWENYDPELHIIERSKLPTIEWTFGSMDWGFTDSGCVQVWGVDKERRLYRLAEIYRTGQTFEWWARRVYRLKQDYNCVTFVADPSRNDNVKMMNDWLSELGEARFVRGADNRKTSRPGAKLDMVGIDLVRWGFNRDATGKPRLFLVKDALLEGPDPKLKDKGKAYCLEMEIPAYVYAQPRPGQPQAEETDTRCADHACFPAGTMVLTAEGERAIETIIPGDQVVTPLGTGTVAESGLTQFDAELWSVRHERGELVATADHPIATQRGWIRLDMLRAGDTLYAWSRTSGKKRKRGAGALGHGIPTARAPRYANTSGTPPTATMGGESACSSTGRSIASASGLWSPENTSTTRTATLRTTLPKTLSWSRRPSTKRDTGLQSGGGSPPSDWIESDTSPLHGTDRRRGALGIAGTPSSCGSSRTRLVASNAAGTTPRGSAHSGFARTTANPRGDARTDATTWRERALSALRRSGSTATPAHRFAPVRVLENAAPNGGRADVYSLRVEPFGCLVASGILLSNCDTMRYGVNFAWRKDFTPPPPTFTFARGTYGWRMRYDELFGHKPEDDEAQFKTPWATTRRDADF